MVSEPARARGRDRHLVASSARAYPCGPLERLGGMGRVHLPSSTSARNGSEACNVGRRSACARTKGDALKKVRMTLTALAATLALGAVPALAQEDGSRNARAQGAPGFFCKQAGAQPGSPQFKACVQLAAKARGQAQNGDGDGGDPNARSKTAPGRFCQANGAAPGSEAFRSCVRTAAKARRSARS